MADIRKLAAQYKDLSEEEQKKAGKAIAGKMDPKHEEFLKVLIKMLDEKTIDTSKPETFINQDVYALMPQEWKGKTDMALINIAEQIDRIANFFRSKETPNESPQLQQMISSLWLMKQRIEDTYDVFKF